MICGQVEEVDPPKEQEDPGLIYYEVACDMKQRENSLGTTKSWKLAQRRNLSFSFLGNVSDKVFLWGCRTKQTCSGGAIHHPMPRAGTKWCTRSLTFVKGCKDAKTQRRKDGMLMG